VQGNDGRLRDLLTGAPLSLRGTSRRRPLSERDLERLQASGVIAAFDRHTIWLCDAPGEHTASADEPGNTGESPVFIALNLPPGAVVEAVAALRQTPLGHQTALLSHAGNLIVTRPGGLPFASRDEALEVLGVLLSIPLFSRAAIAR
jgi:hypothetical protein